MRFERHTIGVHTQNHARLTDATEAELFGEVVHARDTLARLAGVQPAFFRPPYGARNPHLRRVCEQAGPVVVMWSSVGHDWESDDPEAIVDEIMAAATPGGIILLHDGDEGTSGADREVLIRALPQLIERLREAGYRLVTVPDCSEHRCADAPPELTTRSAAILRRFRPALTPPENGIS